MRSLLATAEARGVKVVRPAGGDLDVVELAVLRELEARVASAAEKSLSDESG